MNELKEKRVGLFMCHSLVEPDITYVIPSASFPLSGLKPVACFGAVNPIYR